MHRNERSRSYHTGATLTLSVLFILLQSVRSSHIRTAEHVFIVSYDGLMPHAMARHHLKNFARLRREGAGTSNARNDFDIAQTLPTHMSMFTGLPVEKHGIWEDKDNGRRINPSFQNIFDMVATTGGKTCMFVTKEKFQFFERSWAIDDFYFSLKTPAVHNKFMQQMTGSDPCKFTFLHYRDADFAGHKYHGEKSPYHEAVERLDRYLGEIFDMIESTPHLKDKTAFILTADHGFAESNHSDETKHKNYIIPYYVWGPGCDVTPAADLYLLNSSTRKYPGLRRPSNRDTLQPVRCHDAGPTAAALLGIKAASGRFSRQDLTVGRSSSAYASADTSTTSTTSTAVSSQQGKQYGYAGKRGTITQDTRTTTTAATPVPTKSSLSLADGADLPQLPQAEADASTVVLTEQRESGYDNKGGTNAAPPTNANSNTVSKEDLDTTSSSFADAANLPQLPQLPKQVLLSGAPPNYVPTKGGQCKRSGEFCTRNYECCNSCKKFDRTKDGPYIQWNKCR